VSTRLIRLAGVAAIAASISATSVATTTAVAQATTTSESTVTTVALRTTSVARGAVPAPVTVVRDQETASFRWGDVIAWVRVTSAGTVNVYAAHGYRSAFVVPVTLSADEVERWADLAQRVLNGSRVAGDSVGATLGGGQLVVEPAVAADSGSLVLKVGVARSETVVATVVPAALRAVVPALRATAAAARDQARLAPAPAPAPVVAPPVTPVTTPAATPVTAPAVVAPAVPAPVAVVVPAVTVPAPVAVVVPAMAESATVAPVAAVVAVAAAEVGGGERRVVPVVPVVPVAPVVPAGGPAVAEIPARAAAPATVAAVPVVKAKVLAKARAAGGGGGTVIVGSGTHPIAVPPGTTDVGMAEVATLGLTAVNATTAPVAVKAAVVATPVRRVEVEAPAAAKVVKPVVAKPAVVAAGAGEVLESSTVGNLVRQWEPQLQMCYTDYGLKANPALSGSMVVRVAILNSGDVSTVEIPQHSWSATAGSAAVEACVRGRVKGWAFPPAASASTHDFKVLFTQ
jgi:hypothetical protein